jgi:hypothetical protein
MLHIRNIATLMSTALLLAGCGGNNGNSLPSVVPSSSGQAKQSVGSTPAPTLPPCTSTSTYYVAGALEWPTCQSDPSPTPSATPIIVACNPSTIGTASYMRGLKSVCVPTPAPTQTPSVKILSLSLAGTHSNVNNLLQPTTDQGHFTQLYRPPVHQQKFSEVSVLVEHTQTHFLAGNFRKEPIRG